MSQRCVAETRCSSGGGHAGSECARGRLQRLQKQPPGSLRWWPLAALRNRLFPPALARTGCPPAPSTVHVMPSQSRSAAVSAPRADMSVVLVTGSYDHEIRFWEAWSGICSRTIPRAAESGVRLFVVCV